jgi:fatty-acyl-CoA synthase
MSNIASWIDAHARFTPDKLALIDQHNQYTYAQLAHLIHTNARMLKHQLGIGRGDRLAYLGLNSVEFLCLMFACARLGAMFVPLNWRLATPEYEHILTDARPKALVVTSDFKHQVESLNNAHPDCRFIIQSADQNADQSADQSQDQNHDHKDHAWNNYAGLLQQTSNEQDDYNPHVDLNCPLLIVYTSGTTGLPKGTVLSQNALFYNALNSLHMHDMTSADRILTVLPMFHVGGLNIQTLPALYVGATVILHARFDPTHTLDAIAKQEPSLTVLVPATLMAIMALPQWENTNLSSLRSITTGSSVVPAGLIEPILKRGLPVQQVYGLTETSPIAVYQRIEQALTRPGSTGLTALHCQMQLLGESGETVPKGQVGHILIKGPNVMFEYWGNPKATAQALNDGWFNTGDLGHLDHEGHLVVDDRAKDMIISGGENIYPAELEVHLHGLEGVVEAAVIGRDDPKWGETPIAIVVLAADSTMDKAAILASFKGQLARFKHPSEVVFLPSLPRNVMGKVQKFHLRRMLEQA